MLLASEARDLANQVIYNHQSEEFRKITAGIEREAKAGKFGFSYSGRISPDNRKELERCGYTVEIGRQYNEEYVYIKW